MLLKIKLPLCLIISAALLFAISQDLYGVSDIKETTSVSVSVRNVFSLEFYTDQNVVFSSTVPFTDIDPSKSIVYPDSRNENDGKSDVGVICKSNLGIPWFLKIQLVPNGDLPVENVRFYIDQPYNRNTGGRADGGLAQTVGWYPFSLNPITVYTSGAADQSNLPFGTLATFSYALNPTGLKSGSAYSGVITYTLTTAT